MMRPTTTAYFALGVCQCLLLPPGGIGTPYRHISKGGGLGYHLEDKMIGGYSEKYGKIISR